MQVTSLDRNDFVGRIVIGRVTGGVVRPGMPVVVHGVEGRTQTRVGRVLAFEGSVGEAEEVGAGDLCARGLEVADSATHLSQDPQPLPRVAVTNPRSTWSSGSTMVRSAVATASS